MQGVSRMRKLLFLLLASLLVLGACGIEEVPENEETEVVNEENAEEATEEETENEEVEEEPEENGEIKLNDRLTFAEFTIDFKSLKIEDDIAELDFTWINQAGEGTKQLMNLTLMSVEQNGEELEEINEAWTDFQSDVFRENAEGGEGIVKLEYKLIDDSPITIRFQPLNEFDEEAQEITIELN